MQTIGSKHICLYSRAGAGSSQPASQQPASQPKSPKAFSKPPKAIPKSPKASPHIPKASPSLPEPNLGQVCKKSRPKPLPVCQFWASISATLMGELCAQN